MSNLRVLSFPDQSRETIVEGLRNLARESRR